MLDVALGIGGQLLGGLLGANSASKAAKNAMYMENTKFWRLRHNAEEAGFNPLTALMAGGLNPVASAPSPNNYMGDAVAASGMMLADSVAKTRAAQAGRQVQDLNRQREILQRKLRDATIRPTVPGIFDRARNFGIPPANANSVSDMGGGNGAVVPPAGSGAGLRPLETTNPVDPRRTVEVKPISSTSGFMTVDSPYLPVPLRAPTLDGDEPLQWYDYPSLALPGAIFLGEIAYNAGRDRASNQWKQRLIESYNPRGLKRSLQPHTLSFNPNRADAYYRPGF